MNKYCANIAYHTSGKVRKLLPGFELTIKNASNTAGKRPEKGINNALGVPSARTGILYTQYKSSDLKEDKYLLGCFR